MYREIIFYFNGLYWVCWAESDISFNLCWSVFFFFQGVTYCGESKASSLTMSNVPWHEEVVDFVKQLEDRLPDYELASEHEHSNCLLLAHKKVCLTNHFLWL